MSHELLAALRARTHALHQQLDHHPMMALLLQPTVMPQAYANTLAWLHPLQVSLETQLASLIASFQPHVQLASRVAPLLADLEQLHVAPQSLPNDLKLSLSRSIGSLAGMLYVLNGARLGSAHIARRLQHTSPHLPCRYFAEADGALHWPETLNLLDNLAVSEYSDCEIAAENVFKWYINVMDCAQQDSSCQAECGY